MNTGDLDMVRISLSFVCCFWNIKGMFVFFGKLIFKFFYIYLLLEKLINKKYFLIEEKFSLPEKFKRKTLTERKKFKNIILFVNYIKFKNIILFVNYNNQTFDCYIYFVLNIYFLILFFKILFLY